LHDIIDLNPNPIRYDTIRYDSGYLTCSKKLTVASLVYHTKQTKIRMWN